LSFQDLSDSVNVYIVSDHGMSKPPPENKIQLDKYIDFNADVKYMLDKGSVTMILPQSEQSLQRMHDSLKKANITGKDKSL